MRRRLIALPLLAVLGSAACGSPASPDPSATGGSGERRIVVVTDMYPTTFAVGQVAGDAVDIVQLAPAGVEPHDYELTPQQLQQVAEADLVAYLPGMIPAVEEAVAQEAKDRAVDVTEGIPPLEQPGRSGADDPHVWLDPANMASMGRSVAAALTSRGLPADPAALEADMKQLDDELHASLGGCAITTMVVSHEAFGHLAKAYGFTQVGIAGLSPEAEPSPAKMATITDLVRSEGITTIYFESLVSPAATQTIAAETGAATALLDPVESNTDDAGYPSIMRANGRALQQGQSCS